MLKSILRYICGYAVFHTTAEFSVAFINALLYLGIAEDRIEKDVLGGVTVTVRKRNAAAFEKKLIADGTEYSLIRTGGMTDFLKKYTWRCGLAAGALASALILAISSNYVWGFSVSGNKNVSDSEVIDILEKAGFSVGTRFSDIDFPQFQNDVILTTDKLAWVSVNMLGTLARVEVMEKRSGTDIADGGICANLVAAEDGQIEYIEEASGQTVVKYGDFVRQGDLLISGVRADKSGNIRYEVASGSVRARVTRSFTVKIPKMLPEKVYTGKKKITNSVKIFSKTLNLFTNDGNCYENYDIIDKNKQIILLGSFYVPIFYSETRYEEYITENRELSDDEMVSRAMLGYSKLLKETVGGGELVERDIDSYYEDGAYIIKCTVVCIDEITRSVPVPIS